MQDLQVVDKLSNQSDRLQKTTEKSRWRTHHMVTNLTTEEEKDLNEKL